MVIINFGENNMHKLDSLCKFPHCSPVSYPEALPTCSRSSLWVNHHGTAVLTVKPVIRLVRNINLVGTYVTEPINAGPTS